MLNKDLRAWLNGFLPDVVFTGGPLPDPNQVDAYAIITPTVGGPMTLELQGEQPGFQVRTVGEQSNGDGTDGLDTAEELAYKIDRAILVGPWPKLGNKRIIRTQRFGSGPTPLMVDDADRTHVVCNYIIEIASGY